MKYCLVTVGTTEFRELIHNIQHAKFLNLLINQGIEKLCVQYGTGAPPDIAPDCGLELDFFPYRYGVEWRELTQKAEVTVSHAGAGSCLEALEHRRRLLVVINESLMDNHQEELARALKEKLYLEYCLPQNITAGLEALQQMKLTHFPPGDPSPINGELKKLFCI